MSIKTRYLTFILIAVFSLLPLNNSYSGGSVPGFVFIPDTDHGSFPTVVFEGLIYFYDLRDRETFVQVTYPDEFEFGTDAVAHVQIFDVSNNCNENNFFDNYTINDTHVYNMRDIQTNDGNPSGVVLPEGSYGIVAILVTPIGSAGGISGAFGNLRIIDDNGYEYRTNAQGATPFFTSALFPSDPNARYSFNYNSEAGVTLSDVVGINLLSLVVDEPIIQVWDAQDVVITYTSFDIDILNNNETIFSCRDVIFSCVNQEHPRLEELLETAGTASVASFEYGINNAIPHSKGGELLCPGNTIPEGIVNLTVQPYPSEVINAISSKDVFFSFPFFFGYVGLNNGNGRGSFDSFWVTNIFELIEE